MKRLSQCVIFLSLILNCPAQAQPIQVSGGFEGSNIVDIQEISANTFTCKLKTPPMASPESNYYNSPGDHYHNWFMLKIENAAGQTVNVTITNADWGGGGNGFWGRSDGKAVYSEAADPNALSADTTWKKITNATYTNPNFTFTLTPETDLAWVALSYPALPTHNTNWISALSENPDVNAEIICYTSRELPLYVLFVSDTTYPDSTKKTVLVYGQEHSNEQTGALACQGLVEFLVSGDSVAEALLQNMVFIVIPDVLPDASYEGIASDPDNGFGMDWRLNPAAVERMMPGMSVTMSEESKAIWSRLDSYVDSENTIDFAFNVHQGGTNNWFGMFDATDNIADNFFGYLKNNMPSSGASWVPNNQQGYTGGNAEDVAPYGYPIMRIFGRCWEEWRTIPIGYELCVGASEDNFLNEMRGLKYFGEAMARAFYSHYGQFTKSFSLLTPNGGEMLASGGITNVTWNSEGSPGNVCIDCSTDGGATWLNLISSTADDGIEAVTLPASNSDNCLIRILSNTAAGIADMSNNTFTIGTPPAGSINITSPNGGNTLEGYYRENITWTSTGTINKVNIELSTDGGQDWKRVAYAVPNVGSYVINVPGAESSSCLIRVTNAENSGIGDTSDDFFSIESLVAPKVVAVYPNGGAYILSGSSTDITWISEGFSSNVGIRISTDEGANWTTLVASTSNDGNETVTMPLVSSSKCLIWIYEATMDTYIGQAIAFPLDVTDGLFTIDTLPAITSTKDSSRCEEGTVVLQADANIGEINWYADISGGSSLGIGNSFTTPYLTTTTTFYIDATASGYTSETRTAVTANIYTSPSITSIKDSSRCGEGTVALEAVATFGEINWYTELSGGSPLGTGISFTTPNLTETTSFYVDASENGCTTEPRTEVTATIKTIPSIISTTDSSRCDPGTFVLEAVASNGAVNWYESLTGGISIGTGETFTTPDLTETTSFFADASDKGCTTLSRTEVTAEISCELINQNTSLNVFSFYPNPTKGEIMVTGEGIQQIEVINVNGQTVYKIENVGSLSVHSLHHIAKGIYTIKVIANNKLITQKLLKY